MLLAIFAALILVPGDAGPDSAACYSQWTVAAHGDGFGHGLPCLARLSDERMLLTWSRNTADGADFAVLGAFSADGGCSWSEPRVFLDAPGEVDADPSIVVDGARVLVTCTRTNFREGIRSSRTWCVRSEDNGRSWSEPYEIPMNRVYTCGKCHRGLRLKSGTLLMGYSWDVICEQGQAHQSEGQMDLRAGVMRSTDGGLTWANGGDTHAEYDKVSGGAVSGTDEPALAEMPDGSVYMLMRTGGTRLYEARSDDEGQSWRDVQPSPLAGTNAPAALCAFESEQGPGVLAVWNNARERLPLCAAVSFDGCQTWTAPRDIAAPYLPGGQASYPSCERAPDGAFVVAWQQDVRGGRDVRIARFSLGWLLHGESVKTIVLFGESTTAPRGPLRIFGQVIAERLGAAAHVVNMGIGGENTDAARGRYERDVLAFQPDYVVIYYGLNDAAIDVWKDATEPRVSVARFTENLAHFVDAAKQAGAVPILMTPNPLAWNPQQRELYGKPPYDVTDPEGHNAVLTGYVDAVRGLAQEKQAPLVDVFALLREEARETGYARLLLDGVHPNDYAHALIADSLMPYLK